MPGVSHHRRKLLPPKRRPPVRVAIAAQLIDDIRALAARHGVEWHEYFEELIRRTVIWAQECDRIDGASHG